ncbi:MAG: efflux RND transporter periplasmic adaptor subunit [Isosphaeraceae bacterium]
MREPLTLEQARGKLKLLQNYTRGRTIQELKSQIAERRSAELSRERAYQLAVSKEKKLERQIENCKLIAPSQGVVVYATDPRSNQPPQIEVNATVRERQVIMWINDIDGPMLVNAKMPEAMVDREKVGQKAIVKIDALPDETLTGEVLDIAPLPDPTSFFNADIKVYATHVRIDKPLPGLRPGMSVQVEILLAEHDNALTIPIGAVIRLDGKERVAVKKFDGSFEWREVKFGDSSGTEVEVKQGLKTGEQVAMEPLKLLGRFAIGLRTH